MKTFEVWETSKVTPNLCCFFNSEGLILRSDLINLRGLEDLKCYLTFAVFFNSEGFRLNSPHLDLRGLKDLKGGPQRSPTNSYLCGLRSQRLP